MSELGDALAPVIQAALSRLQLPLPPPPDLRDAILDEEALVPVLAVCRSDPKLRAVLLRDQFGNPVDPSNEWLELGIRLSHVLYQYIVRAPNLEWNRKVFSEVLRQLESFVCAGGVARMRLVAPLRNFQSDSHLIRLDVGLVIRRLTDRDKAGLWARYLLGGSIAPRFATHESARLGAATHAIVQEWTFPGPAPTCSARDALTAIRILKPGGVSVLRYFVSPEQPVFFDLPRSFAPPLLHRVVEPLDLREPYTLERRDSNALRRLWRAYLSRLEMDERELRRVNLAIHRFDLTYERVMPHDRLIDTWIALETLFASDGGAEITYRVSRRIPHFLEQRPEGRRELRSRVLRSYKARSAIVHGDPDPPNVTVLADDAEAMLRRALILVLEQGRPPEPDRLDTE